MIQLAGCAHGQMPDGSEGIAWHTVEASAFEKARLTGRPVVIDFFAEWCAPCEELDRRTWSDPRVRQVLHEQFVALRVDGTEESEPVLELQDRYGVDELPRVVFVRPDGRVIGRTSLAGFFPPEVFLESAGRAIGATLPPSPARSSSAAP